MLKNEADESTGGETGSEAEAAGQGQQENRVEDEGARDVRAETERLSRRVEELEARLALARRLADDLPVYVSSFLPDGTLTYVNRALAEHAGESVESLMGRNFFTMMAEQERATLQGRLGELTPESPIETHEQRCQERGGATSICHWSNRAIFDAGGRVTHYQAVGVDVTKRREAEEALKESEANFRSFFESITDVVTVATLDGKVVQTNSAATRLLGYTQEELAEMDVAEMHPEAMREEAAMVLGELMRGARAVCLLPLGRKDGGMAPVETRVWMGRWNGEECLFGVSKDLSAEQEAQQRFERAFRHNPALMALSELPERRFVDVNDAWMEALGYTRDEVIGSTSTELGLTPQPERLDLAAGELMAGGSIAGVEMQVRRKDGQLLDGVFSGELIRIHGREYLLTVMIDVTERKAAERRLADERRRMEQVIGATGAATWEWNVETGETVFNATWAEQLGYAAEELEQGRIENWEGLLNAEDLPRWKARLEEHFAGRAAYFDCESRLRKKDGGWIWVHDLGQLMSRTEDGRPWMMFGAHTDVTARKKAEAELRQALEEKEGLLREVHHRVKNNLQVVSSLLHLQCHSVKDAAVQEALNDTQMRVRSMALLHENLYRTGHMDRVECSSYLEHLCGRISYTLGTGRQGITLRAEVWPADLTLDLDQAAPCGLIITELVTNACKHAFPDGRGGTVRVEMRESGGEVVLAVRDDGVGISSEVDVEGSRTLGLDLVRGFAQQMRAKLEWKRQPGTSVELRFSAREAT